MLAPVGVDNQFTSATPNPAQLAYLYWLNEDELARERAIVQVRAYHNGIQQAFLTPRMKKILGDSQFNLNIVRTVIMAVAERLIVSGWKSTDQKLTEWATAVWLRDAMQARHADLHESALVDGEAFVLMDWDGKEKRVTFTPHPRYTDAIAVVDDNNGEGFGCKAFYPNDDYNLPMSYASKRWIEHLGGGRARQLLNLYFPDRIEKYEILSGAGLKPRVDTTDNPESNGVLPWRDRTGKPLGIPLVHFQAPGLRSEAADAVPMQKAINKSLIDLLIAADYTGFQVLVSAGVIPTLDGQPAQKDSQGNVTNAITIEPGIIISTERPANEVNVHAIPGADLSKLWGLVEKLIVWTAMVTSTPISRFQMTGQVAGEGTQKENETPLLAKCQSRQTSFSSKWTECLNIARRIENVFGVGGLDERAAFEPQWKPLEPRDTLVEMAQEKAFWDAAISAVKAGSSLEFFLQRNGISDKEIAKLKGSSEFQARMALLQTGLNAGGG